jgi:transposase
MQFKSLQAKRQYISGKTVIGIDPAKKKHQVVILDSRGVQLGKTFTFTQDVKGYTKLWEKVKQNINKCKPQEVVFAIESSCNLWQNLAYHIFSKGYDVLLVSPLTTHHSRPFLNHDFSRTDPKDAHLVASNSRDGYFDYYREFTPQIRAMHHLSITYDKLKKNLVQNRNRLRALVERVFPEFVTVLNLDTDTALYLLRHYFLPEHYVDMDIEEVVPQIQRISQKQHGRQTLEQLQQAACNSIGIPLSKEEELSYRLALDSWIILIETIRKQQNMVLKEMIVLAQQTPYFEVLKSLKGVSDKLAALFIAETRDLSQFTHYKRIEKFAGYNLRQSQSGEYVGARHMSHIGNKRLSWVLYKMCEETAKYVPEVRIKFIRRQLKKRNYRKNLIASSSTLLKLIVALISANRPYQAKQQSEKQLQLLEKQYAELKQKDKKKYGQVS